MGTTALVFHLEGPSLVSLTNSSSPQKTASSPLALPYRFPKSSSPLAAISPAGHVYLYGQGGSHVWEYDALGRRVSEMSFTNGHVHRVLGLGKEVIVALQGGIRVMEKEGGKWRQINVLEGPMGRITAAAGSGDGGMVALGSHTGDVVVYDQQTGTRLIVPLGEKARGPIKSCMTFSPTLPTTLVIPTQGYLTLVKLPTLHTIETHPFSSTSPREVVDIAFSPVIERKGGLCAVLRRDGREVALVGLENPNSASKVVDFGQELAGVSFMNGATLAGWTKDGTLLVKDLRALSKEAVEIKLEEPITGLQVLPTLAKSSHPSLVPAASATSTRRSSVLGELRNAGNVDSPPISLHGTHKGKDKAVVRTADAVARTLTLERPKKAVDLHEEPERNRAVSVPSSAKRPRRSAIRSSSGPSAPSSSAIRPSSAAMVTAPIVEEDEEPSPSHRQDELELDLAWALRPPSRAAILHRERDDDFTMEETRREIANLQLDMLRMGRNLKVRLVLWADDADTCVPSQNEIRRAVTPLLIDLKEGREVIERQRREIERLRRGY